MAGFENIRTKKAHDPMAQYDDETMDAPAPQNALDSEESQDKLKQLKEWWYECRTQHSENRYEQSLDADFYDGLQWSIEDKNELRDRGQAPLVFNVIQQHVNWIIGTERRMKVDFHVFPREADDNKASETKTKLMKYVSDVNKAPFQRSRAFEDAVKVGIGWLEEGIRSDPLDEPLFSRTESWRNIWWDSLAKETDLSDARFLFRAKWVDKDIAIAMFPDRKAAIERSAVSHDLVPGEEDEDLSYTGLYSTDGDRLYASGRSYFNDAFHVGLRRQRVRLVECWYRDPVPVRHLRAPVHAAMNPQIVDVLRRMNGQEYAPDNMAHEQILNDGYASVYDSVRMKVHCAVFCNDYLLQDVISPYAHDRFPFTPVWGYRRDRDGMPYGVVRNMRDPQEDLNKRRSKALHILSTSRIIADEDAVEDWDELEEQAGRPDAIIRKRRGSELEIDTNNQLASEHVALMEQDKAFLENASGVTQENKGEVTNAVSGRAIGLRQNQGSVVTEILYDNLRHAIQLQGELQLSLIEQYYDEPKIIRLTNDRHGSEFTNINYPQQADDGSFDVQNDITKNKADFIVDLTDFRENVRVAMFETMMELLGQMPPEVSMELLDLVVEMSDVPNKTEIVRRVRRLNNQVDPDDPDKDQKEAERDAADAERSDIEKRQQSAVVAETEAKAADRLASTASKNAQALEKATAVAAMLSENPKLAELIDELYVSMQEGEPPNPMSVPQGATPVTLPEKPGVKAKQAEAAKKAPAKPARNK